MLTIGSYSETTSGDIPACGPKQPVEEAERDYGKRLTLLTSLSLWNLLVLQLPWFSLLFKKSGRKINRFKKWSTRVHLSTCHFSSHLNSENQLDLEKQKSAQPSHWGPSHVRESPSDPRAESKCLMNSGFQRELYVLLRPPHICSTLCTWLWDQHQDLLGCLLDQWEVKFTNAEKGVGPLEPLGVCKHTDCKFHPIGIFGSAHLRWSWGRCFYQVPRVM